MSPPRSAGLGPTPPHPTPPRPPSRPDRAGPIARLRLARRDLLSAQPERLYDAMMAEMHTPVSRSVLLNDPELVAEVLACPAREFPKPPRLAGLLGDLLGASVFVTNGAEWQRARRLIDPAFAGGRLGASLPAMWAAGQAALDRLGAGGAVEAEAETSHIAADVILRAMVSRPITAAEAATLFVSFRAYARAAPLLSPLILLRAPRWLPRPFRRGRAEARAIRALIAGLVETRAAELAAGTAPDDLATRLMTARDPETGAGFSPAEMADQLAIFLLAGHETSAATLAWALWLLATHEEAQAAVAAEAAHLPRGVPPDLDALRGLGATRAVVQETLRLYPPVPMMLRETRATTRWRGRRLGRGTLVILSPWHLHRHRRFWPEPDAFCPARWETPGTIPRAAYMPFSAGPRICPGAGFAMMEVTLLLAMLVGRFRIAPAGPPPRPMAQLTLRAESGISLTLTPR